MFGRAQNGENNGCKVAFKETSPHKNPTDVFITVEVYVSHCIDATNRFRRLILPYKNSKDALKWIHLLIKYPQSIS